MDSHASPESACWASPFITAQCSAASMPVRSCRQPWGMNIPKRMAGNLPLHRERCPRCRVSRPGPGTHDEHVILGYTAAQVRAAEQPLLERGPEGALMERAAFSLAVRVCRLLRERRGAVRGAQVVALVGPGSN